MNSIRRGTAAALSLFAALQSASAFQFQSGDLKGSFDTTLSIGGMYRLSNPDPLYYSTSSSFRGVAGLQNSGNADDGNLNFPSGIVSELVKASHELELRYHNVGGLVRGYYFYDNHVMDYWKGRTQLSDEALRRVGRGAEWLDMYGYGKFELAGRPLDLRIGRQVLSLGESTFIPNGINVVNPVDLAKLRVPGAELKEALLPVNMVKASWALTENFTVEPFWLLEFRRNEIEPNGTYFSTNDYASKGGSKVMLGFGSLSDQGTLGAITRVTDKQYNGRAQGGLAAHLMAPALNDTEFGFYYVRYNSRSPVLSARTPTSAINTNLVGPLTQAILSSVPIPSAAQIAGAQAQASAIFTAYVTSLTNPGALTATQAAMLQSPTVKAALAGAQKIAFLNAANTGTYWVEFPEGIDMVGLSFNTNLARTGISWQGEMAYKKGVPLQVDDVELLFAALGSLNQAYAANNQIGNLYGKLGQEIQGWRRHDVWTAQTSMTKVFAPALGASQLTVVGEVGGLWANLPSKDVLRYEGSGTFTSGSAAYMAGTGNSAYPATPYSSFADSFSWGYQLLARADYTNVFAGVNVTPSLAFSHDVSGNSPLPLASFVRGRKSVTVGMDFTYMNRWTVEFRYVNYFGAERYNLLNDRDYVSGSIKYSF